MEGKCSCGYSAASLLMKAITDARHFSRLEATMVNWAEIPKYLEVIKGNIKRAEEACDFDMSATKHTLDHIDDLLHYREKEWKEIQQMFHDIASFDILADLGSCQRKERFEGAT